MVMNDKVAVLGGCGRIGLPLTYIIANSGYFVHCIDPKATLPEYKDIDLENVPFPYKEDGFSMNDTSWKKIFTNNVNMTNLYSHIVDCSVVVVVIGTPVDAEDNPRIDAIIDLFDNVIVPRMTKGQLIILRSTVTPFFTDMIRRRLRTEYNLFDGFDYHIVFAPERVSQGHSLEETSILPQIIGTYQQESYDLAVNFFKSIGVKECIHLTPREAEFSKLVTNMYRYINIAFANEMYMVASENDGIDIHKVIKASNYNYPRMNMPLPGPNAAGPCLFKDGKLITQNIPYSDLIRGAFNINEGMPVHMIKLMEKYSEKRCLYDIKKVLIAGSAFKPEQDDTRFSASYKLKKLLKLKGYDVDIYDSIAREYNLSPYQDYDAVFLMTPHHNMVKLILDCISKRLFKNECIIVDGWKALGDTTETGVFMVEDLYE